MKISKKDALMWFRFFAELPEDEPLMPHQQELAWAVISQIETAVDARHKELMAQIPDLHTLGGRTYFVGDPADPFLQQVAGSGARGVPEQLCGVRRRHVLAEHQDRQPGLTASLPGAAGDPQRLQGRGARDDALVGAAR